MNVILLSGGSGKRLWPLSNEVRSKQFVKLFKEDNGKIETSDPEIKPTESRRVKRYFFGRDWKVQNSGRKESVNKRKVI